MGGKLDIMKRVSTLLAILNKGPETLFTAEVLGFRRERDTNSIDQRWQGRRNNISIVQAALCL